MLFPESRIKLSNKYLSSKSVRIKNRIFPFPTKFSKIILCSYKFSMFVCQNFTKSILYFTNVYKIYIHIYIWRKICINCLFRDIKITKLVNKILDRCNVQFICIDHNVVVSVIVVREV